jgi:hypothetical protein
MILLVLLEIFLDELEDLADMKIFLAEQVDDDLDNKQADLILI